MEPTDLQKAIIDYEGNTVVLASPGSGKTFVVSEKIRRILRKDNILPYHGVIAISYTRKASANLKRRTVGDGLGLKNSFFGTIDNFCLTQIVEPFGDYVFGHPQQKLTILELNDMGKDKSASFTWIDKNHPDYVNITAEQMSDIGGLFREGVILVESLELIALHIVLKCVACQNYLRARYKYIFIDEFQDADTYTSSIFLKLIDLGLTGFAVGDENQSIFGFAHKDSKYIRKLKNNSSFKEFSLNKNFRCPIPIINYSNRLLDEKCPIVESDEEAVFLIRISGSEFDIAQFIDKNLKKICKQWNVLNNSKIAILVKNNRTQEIIDKSLTTPHRKVRTTKLDEDLNPKSRLFSILLQFYFDKTMPFMSVIDEYVDYGTLSQYDKKRLNEYFSIIRSIEEDDIDELPDNFRMIANILLPKIDEGSSMIRLKSVLSDKSALYSYMPMNDNEIQLMTLYKSKGLEFDIVFHLNVCEWELPSKRVENNNFNNPIYNNWEQDIYLHYVGITRASKACYLIRGTYRTNFSDDLKTAKDSEFLNINDLPSLRKDYN